MKKTYEKPELKVIKLTSEDIITLSGVTSGGDINLPTIGWGEI